MAGQGGGFYQGLKRDGDRTLRDLTQTPAFWVQLYLRPVCSDESETWGSETSPLLWAALGECAETPDGRIQRRPAGKGTSWASGWSLGIVGSIRQKHQHRTRAELEGGFRLGGVPG